MRSILDPNANSLWNSVGVTIDADGVQQNLPQNEEWTELYNRALALVQATNLLLVPNRHFVCRK